MCGVSSTLLSYLRRISDVRVAYLAYQWHMCYVYATYVSLLWSMCDVLGVLGIFYGIPKESLMLLYRCFRVFFSRNNTHTGPDSVMVTAFASEAGGAGSNPGRVIPKTLKMVPVATLLGAQHS